MANINFHVISSEEVRAHRTGNNNGGIKSKNKIASPVSNSQKALMDHENWRAGVSMGQS